MNLKDIAGHGESPMVTIPGIGQMTLAQAKQGVQVMIEHLAERVRQNQWKELKSSLDHGILQVYIAAIVEAQNKQH